MTTIMEEDVSGASLQAGPTNSNAQSSTVDLDTMAFRPVEGSDPADAMSGLTVTAHPVGARVITVHRHRLDAEIAVELRRLSYALLAHSTHPILLDLTTATHTEPTAVDAIVDFAYQAGDANVDFRLVCDAHAPTLTPILARPALFKVYPTTDAALDQHS